MALYWREARTAVRCDLGTEEAGTWPPDTLVVLASPEQAADPAFAQDLRDLLDWRCERARGRGEGDARDGAEPQGPLDALADAVTHDGGRRPEVHGDGWDPDGWERGLGGDGPVEWLDDDLMGYLGAMPAMGLVGPGAAPMVQVFVGSCGRLHVGE